MKFHIIAIAATVALTSGIGVASAAGSQAMSKTSTTPAMRSMAKNSPSMAKDSLSLTALAGTNRVERPQQAGNQPDGAHQLHGLGWRHDSR